MAAVLHLGIVTDRRDRLGQRRTVARVRHEATGTDDRSTVVQNWMALVGIRGAERQER
jgi:hypothetical protein